MTIPVLHWRRSIRIAEKVVCAGPKNRYSSACRRKPAGPGQDIVGPVSADTIFMHTFRGEYDAVVTLYHDQGQIATKLLAFDEGVTVAGGLPYAITTPEHGTAFDIAGKGIAKTSSFARTIRLATRCPAGGEKSIIIRFLAFA